MQGLANGINNSKSLVTNAVKGLSTDISVGMRVNAPTVSTSGTVSSNNLGKILDTMDSMRNEISTLKDALSLTLNVDGKEFTQAVVAPNQSVLANYYKGR